MRPSTRLIWMGPKTILNSKYHCNLFIVSLSFVSINMSQIEMHVAGEEVVDGDEENGESNNNSNK